MKKVDIDKLVSKAMIVTAAILGIMFGAWLIQEGYFSYTTVLAMRWVTIVISVVALLIAIAFVVLGIKKNSKFFEPASWSAGVAIFTTLLKINYEVGHGLNFTLFGRNFMFFNTAMYVLLAGLIINVVYVVYKIIRY